MATLESRATVGLRAAKSRPRIPGPVRGTTAHYNGPKMFMKGKPHSHCRERWRGVQLFHIVKNGWADVAYSAAVCHHEIAMEGRGPGVRTAANGTNAGNNAWYAIFFMVGEGEEPSVEMLRAAEWYARVHLKAPLWNRHTDHKPTACAGPVNKYVVNGRLVIAGESTVVKLGDRVLRFSEPMMRGDDVKEWQTLLNRWRAGVAGTPDGVFGPTTRAASARFMDEVMNVKTDDPRVGAATVKAMRDTLTSPVAPPPPPTPKPKPAPGPFTDVPADHAFAKDIARAKELGIFKGKADGSFGLGEHLTREAAAAVLVRMYDALKE